MLVFADDYTIAHPLAKSFLSDLDSLCIRDYGKSFFHQMIKCLDMDAVEIAGTNQQDCTMDAAVGVGNYQNSQTTSKRFALVELRFNYKSANNLDYTNMSRKVSHTRDLLLPSPVHPAYYFVFTDKVQPQAFSQFMNIGRQKKFVAQWKAVSPSQLLNEIQFIPKQLYIPKYSPSIISSYLNSAFSKGESVLVDKCDEWINKAAECQRDYENQEALSILNTMLKTLNTFSNAQGSMAEWIDFIKDEVTRKIGSIK